MPTAIKVENLSKSYLISHQGRERDIALRDVLSGAPRRLWTIARENLAALRINQKHPGPRSSSRSSPGRMPKTEEFWALRDLSMNIAQGERIGIIGHNGAGKSTLLKLLSRITEPTRGRISLRGKVASLLEVGTGFHPELTGRENIFLNGAILGMGKSEIKRKFDAIVSFAEVERFLDTPVKRYSSGMYVRLAFAVAAHLESEILIVDEVLAVGDSQFQKKCLGKMEDISLERRTLLFVSHNLVAVQALCNRGIVLSRGRKVFDGSTEDAIHHYTANLETDSVEIRHRKDRRGSGRARVVGLKVFNQHGVETTTIGMGEDFRVLLDIEGSLSNVIIGVLIGNSFIRQICRGYTDESYSGEINIHGRLNVECHFREVPLVHGSYNIHTWVGIRGEVADEVDNAVEINIIEKDIFRTGKIMNPKHNMFFVRHDWSFCKP